MKLESRRARLRRCVMQGALHHGTHHFGDLIFTAMERVFLTTGAITLTLAALAVIYLGIFLLR
jgi:hypothetical protein